MMRVLLLSIMVISSAVVARADKGSWKQDCQKGHGTYSVLKQEAEEFPVCFFGEAVVGAESWSQLKQDGVKTESVKAYKERRTPSVRGGVCGAFDADLVVVKDGQGTSYNFCRFEDKSVMEETTLWLGPGASISDSFDKALSKIN